MVDNLKLHKKWKSIFACTCGQSYPGAAPMLEKAIFQSFVAMIMDMKFPMGVALKVLINKIYFQLKLYWSLNNFVLKKYLLKNSQL